MSDQGVFHSEAGRQAVHQRYAEVLGQFPFDQRTVQTPAGRTFVLEAGNPEAPAVVLLHGSCSNSAFWFADIMALAGTFHVFAVDLLGEAGNSAEVRLDLSGDGYAEWLRSLLNELNLDTASLIGNSLGGWMALKAATSFPERIRSLVLLASAGLVPINAAFMDASRVAVRSGPDSMQDLNDDVVDTSGAPPEVLAFIRLILQHFRPITDNLPVFSDEALRRLDMPIRFLAGSKDPLIDGEAGAERLRRLLPHASVEVLPGAGHLTPGMPQAYLPFLLQESSG